MLIGTNEKIVIIGAIATLLLSLITKAINMKETKDKNIPIIFYMCVCNIALLIITNFVIN